MSSQIANDIVFSEQYCRFCLLAMENKQEDSPQYGGRVFLLVLHSQERYLMVTLAPTSAILAAMRSASSLETASLMGLGASSTTALASFRPRPVSSRTTLMTWILLGPTSVRTASNSVCSSTGASAGAASCAATAGPAAAATGAALTPHLSCRALVNCTKSNTLSCSISAMMESTD